MVKVVKKYYWVWVGVLFLFLRLPSLFEPYWYGDEGIYLAIGQAIRKGVTLYLRIHDNKPPTLYYLAAIGQTVFGFRLILMLVMIPTVILFYKVAKNFLNENRTKIVTIIFLVLTSIPVIEGNIANSEIFMLLPTIAGIGLVYKAKNRWSYLWAGLLLGIAFTIKVPVAVEAMFAGLWIVITKLKKEKFKIVFDLTVFGIGFVIPITWWGLYFLRAGAINDFLAAALLQNFGYLSSWQHGASSGNIVPSGLMMRLIIMLVSWVLFYVLYLGKKTNSKLLFLMMWFLATIFGALLSGRPYPHYLIQVLPPFVMLLAYGWTLVIVLAILATVILKYKFYFYRTIPYYVNFYANNRNFRNYFGGNVESIYKIADYIRKNSSEEDKIFVWGNEPYLFPLSDRLPATKYIVTYHIEDFKGYDLTMEQLKINMPKFVVYYKMNGKEFSKLNEFLCKYYYVDEKIGESIIFRQR